MWLLSGIKLLQCTKSYKFRIVVVGLYYSNYNTVHIDITQSYTVHNEYVVCVNLLEILKL